VKRTAPLVGFAADAPSSNTIVGRVRSGYSGGTLSLPPGQSTRGGDFVSETDVFDVERLNRQNGIALGRVLGSGKVEEAQEGADGKMTGTIRIPEDELVYEPGVLVMPHGGVIELTIINDDKNTHCAVMPSNGDTQFLWLVNHSKGTATLELDGPGYYWYGSTTGNDEGRGLTGAIVVGGDVPPEAQLDRPPQPRPTV
jgi:PQQ system protein